MSRPQRIEFAGACYHVMARGNARERIYLDDALGSVSYCYDARGNLLEKVRSSQAVPTGALAPKRKPGSRKPGSGLVLPHLC